MIPGVELRLSRTEAVWDLLELHVRFEVRLTMVTLARLSVRPVCEQVRTVSVPKIEESSYETSRRVNHAPTATRDTLSWPRPCQLIDPQRTGTHESPKVLILRAVAITAQSRLT